MPNFAHINVEGYTTYATNERPPLTAMENGGGLRKSMVNPREQVKNFRGGRHVLWQEKKDLREELSKSLLDLENGGSDIFSMDEKNGRNAITNHKQKMFMEGEGQILEREYFSLKNLKNPRTSPFETDSH